MPYKCEKIKIANTQYDRRIKLSDDDKEEIQDRYFNHGESMRTYHEFLKWIDKLLNILCFQIIKNNFTKQIENE